VARMAEHPDRDALERFILGQLSPAEMREISSHLLTGCEPCRVKTSGLWNPEEEPVDLLDAEAPPVELPEGPDDSEYDRAIERAFLHVRASEPEIERQRDAAAGRLEELLRHPPARRRLLVVNSLRFHDRILCDLLLERSREAGLDDPSAALDLARLALEIVSLLTPEAAGGPELLEGLRARAWAQLGNALRVGGDLAAAEAALGRAEALLGQRSVGLLETAQVLDLLASLRKDQRRFPEAVLLLDRVAGIYRRLGQWHLLGRTLRQKASVYTEEGGHFEIRIALLRQALDLLDPRQEPLGFLGARHNLIVTLAESGRAREAFALLFHTRPLYLKMGDRLTLLRLRWVEGRIALGLERIEQASAAFREVRDAYVDLGLDYDAALVSLDLALVYARQGRASELRALAEEMLTIFQSRNIHREAMAALFVFCAAAREEEAELALVEEVSDFLRRARRSPDLRFTPQAS
jgi:tetratricopeptide (TPR) repeat protein